MDDFSSKVEGICVLENYMEMTILCLVILLWRKELVTLDLRV